MREPDTFRRRRGQSASSRPAEAGQPRESAPPSITGRVGGDEIVATALDVRVQEALGRALAKGAEPGLTLVATPIGNLADITLRALAVLATADIVYAEDTRHSAHLLSHYGIRTTLRSYHEHNADRERPAILRALAEGRAVAVVSDAGTPLVSDPGFKLVREAIAAGHPVHAVPGASAPLTALVAAGLPTDAFLFAGFLPPRSQARRSRIAELAHVPATLIFFESPGRLAATLEDLAAELGPRQAAVARELTKLNEEFARAPLPALAAEFAARETIKGEIVILVAPPGAEAEAGEEEICRRLGSLLQDHSLRDAARIAAAELGVPKGRAYDLALALRRQMREDAPGEGPDDGPGPDSADG